MLPSLLIRRCARELSLAWAFIRYDVSSTLAPAALFTCAAQVHLRPELGFGWALARASVYFFLYVYAFCLANQIVGVEEDRLNKPDRPLVIGRSTVAGARARLPVVVLLMLAVGWAAGVGEWAALWALVLWLHNQGGWSRRWTLKSLCMGVGVVAELAAAWQMVGPLCPHAWRWILVLASAIMLLVPVQDLRDVAGDRRSERVTLPMVLGEARARGVLALGFLLLPVVIHLGLLSEVGPWLRACELGLAGMSAAIAWRIVRRRGGAADHRTYLLFTYWYCMVLASAIGALA